MFDPSRHGPPTIEDLLQIDDGVEREAVRGELRGRPWTPRDRRHARCAAVVACVLLTWLDSQPEGYGIEAASNPGIRLCRDPRTIIGSDVALFTQEVAARSPAYPFYDGVPLLAVEVLSPTDLQGVIDEKIDLFLEAGTPLVWLIDPHFHTVTIVRPDAPPRLVAEPDTLDAEPHLPGFAVPVARLFGPRP
jgi:Uma2 family endonuclease